MTVILAAYNKDKDIILASERQVNYGNLKKNYSSPKILKKGNMLIGVSGQALLRKVIEYNFILPEHKKITGEKYIKTVFVDELRKCIKENNAVKLFGSQEDTSSSILIGYQGCIYDISSDFCVIKYSKGYRVIGIGSYFSIGALYLYKEINKNIDIKGVKLAIKAAIEHDVNCSGKIDVFVLKKIERR